MESAWADFPSISSPHSLCGLGQAYRLLTAAITNYQELGSLTHKFILLKF